MTILIALYIFMLGAALGSFALVVADRWNTKRSWVRGRSQCDTCKKTLRPIELMPLFSWVFAKGRCRHCAKKVSARYPAVELVSAVILLSVFYLFPHELSFNDLSVEAFMLCLLWVVIHTLSLVLILIDLRTMLMPYTFLATLIVSALLFRILILTNEAWAHPSFVSLVIGLLLGGGLFAMLWLLSRGKWIGDSDILLGVAIALIVGGAVEVWIAFVSASLTGLLYGVGIAWRKHSPLKHMKIPFGPFLVLGMLISFLFSEYIIDLYLKVFIPY